VLVWSLLLNRLEIEAKLFVIFIHKSGPEILAIYYSILID